MTAYAIFEIAVVGVLVGACAFAISLRLLPTSWLKSPLGIWFDRAGRPAVLRRVGARWRNDARSGCANGCCPTGDGCAIGRRNSVDVDPGRNRRIPLTLVR